MSLLMTQVRVAMEGLGHLQLTQTCLRNKPDDGISIQKCLRLTTCQIYLEIRKLDFRLEN